MNGAMGEIRVLTISGMPKKGHYQTSKAALYELRVDVK
jgi:hypothetical protein